MPNGGVIRLTPAGTPARIGRFTAAARSATLLPVLLATMAVAGASRTVSAQAPDLDPRITTLVANVSEERLGAILKKLESFETRSTLSSTNSPTRGIGAAR